MCKLNLIFIVLYVFLCHLLPAQEKENTARKTFTLDDMEELLMANHPIVKQVNLLSETAKVQVMQALGKFDPTINASFKNKHFGNKEYYNEWNSELKIPLWLAGADLKIAYDRNVGDYTNPQSRTNNAGLSAVGLSIPLGQGLIIDSRRNTLQQAKAMIRYLEGEKIKQINSIWFQAVSDYWNWYFAYQQYQFLLEGVKLADQRFKAISEQTALGDKPVIDSVEAYVVVKERWIELSKYEAELKNARIMLSNHLWNDQQFPVELPDYAVPHKAAGEILLPDNKVIHALLDSAKIAHPELIKLASKNQQLEFEERYRKEMLKPKLTVSGTLISNRRSFNDFIPPQYDFNWQNYKLGFEFAFPLFIRSERGKLKEVRIKLDQLHYEQVVTERNIYNDVIRKYNELTAYSTQFELHALNVSNQERLLKGELNKFELGESTLFVVNSRESKLIEMRIKQEKLFTDFRKALAELYYKAGTKF
ncbi:MULTISPECIES: TolC family protein [unclassified Sphingobacterium]|uniref:TolC family protein n=1 Tax=unclassified Sphingobacterium TaxID=2609468 RepID=UPI001AE93853|nr:MULTISPECIES: TolC family protein [unclassified Sphingobacterium]MDR6734351.1 outer membrane protein TolC [Sphingobacterium sp. 2149]